MTGATEPYTSPSLTPSDRAPSTTCASCDQPLAGGTWRCRLCVRAAEIAVAEIRGRHVLASDIARVRARLDL